MKHANEDGVHGEHESESKSQKPSDQDPVPFLGNAQEARVWEQETGRGVNDCCISYTLSLSEASDSKQREEMLEIKRKINRSHLWKLNVVC